VNIFINKNNSAAIVGSLGDLNRQKRKEDNLTAIKKNSPQEKSKLKISESCR
jgi:hypothetical protein